MSSPIRLHIAILDCDTPVPGVYAERGLYSDIFITLLNDTKSNLNNLLEVDLQFSKYDCVAGKLPSEADLQTIDGILITGSSASAYDPAPWIFALTDFTRNIHTQHTHIKLFGSCFGHQLICHALFSTPNHNAVSRDPKGWELGVHPITLSKAFVKHFGPVTSNPASESQLRLQFVHADHVVLRSLPEGFHPIGRSEHCALQGIWKKGKVLTYQGHAEFDRFVNSETLKVFGKPIWQETFLEEALSMVDEDDDSMWAAGVMLRFFSEDIDEVAKGDVEGVHSGRLEQEDVMARL